MKVVRKSEGKHVRHVETSISVLKHKQGVKYDLDKLRNLAKFVVFSPCLIPI